MTASFGLASGRSGGGEQSSPPRHSLLLVFERFTERGRQVVVFAQEEARALGHNYIGTEHLLLGLLREAEGLGGRVLELLGVTLEEVRGQVEQIVGRGGETRPGQIPFTPRAKKVLEQALREAIGLGHNHIGTEHVLLGLARQEGVAAQILAGLDVSPDKIRDKITRPLSQSPVDPVIRQPRPLPRGTGRASQWRGIAATLTHGPRPRQLARNASVFFVLGWSSFAVALALGVLIGWLIWGQ
jgi:ATP-dependent Clp protease ATP-binding subunit ClpC